MYALGKNVSIASRIPYCLQKAPTIPCLDNGSCCFVSSCFTLTDVSEPGTCGHDATSRQSIYSARMPSADKNGLSANLNTYCASLEHPGQYMSLEASNVVESIMPMPIKLATLRAIGSYSSGVMVRSVGMTTRNRGRCGVCERVLYTAYAIPKLSTVRTTLSVWPGSIASRSRVIRSRPVTLIALRWSPIKLPPTKPPMSFNLACADFGS